MRSPNNPEVLVKRMISVMAFFLPFVVVIGLTPAAVNEKREAIIRGIPVQLGDAKDAGPVSPPAISGPEEAGFLAVMKITGVPANTPVFWSLNPEELVETFEPNAETTFVLGGPAGTYKVRAQFAIDGKKQLLEKKVKLTGGGAPVPRPIGSVSRFVVVEDTSKPGKWRGDILGSPKVKSFYRQLQGQRSGSIHAIYDSSAKPETLGEEGRKFVALANGKELPYLFLLDQSGNVLTSKTSPRDPDSFVAAFEIHAGERSFGLVVQAPKLKWNEFGFATNTPMVDRAQWPDYMSLSAFLPTTYDQDGIGQCASSAACGLYEFASNQAGLTPIHVSAGDLYRRVNGGRDNGSTLEDNMVEMLERGVLPVSPTSPYVWDRRSAYSGSGRDKFRFSEVYLCKTFDAAASAIIQGFAVEIGITWHGNYKPDSKGVLPSRGSGSVGGHALYCYGIVKLSDGKYGLLTRNSWGPAWGGSSDGTVDAGSCIIPESAFTGYIGGFYAVRSVVNRTTARRFGDLRDVAIAF